VLLSRRTQRRSRDNEGYVLSNNYGGKRAQHPAQPITFASRKRPAPIFGITLYKTTTTSMIKSYPRQASVAEKMFSFSATLVSFADNVQSGTHICK